LHINIYICLSYLSGDQLTSTSSADCYRAAIMAGARLVESKIKFNYSETLELFWNIEIFQYFDVFLSLV